MSEDRKPFWAKCGACLHCWPAAYLPMAMDKCAEVLKSPRCPMCGGKNVLVAKQDDGKLLESARASA